MPSVTIQKSVISQKLFTAADTYKKAYLKTHLLNLVERFRFRGRSKF